MTTSPRAAWLGSGLPGAAAAPGSGDAVSARASGAGRGAWTVAASRGLGRCGLARRLGGRLIVAASRGDSTAIGAPPRPPRGAGSLTPCARGSPSGSVCGLRNSGASGVERSASRPSAAAARRTTGFAVRRRLILELGHEGQALVGGLRLLLRRGLFRIGFGSLAEVRRELVATAAASAPPSPATRARLSVGRSSPSSFARAPPSAALRFAALLDLLRRASASRAAHRGFRRGFRLGGLFLRELGRQRIDAQMLGGRPGRWPLAGSPRSSA